MSGTATITDAQYRLLIEAFKKSPEGYEPARRFAGVTEAAARRAWLIGDQGRPSIKSIVADEQQMARAAMEITRQELKNEVRLEAGARPVPQAISQEVKAAIRADAIRARTKEALLVRAARDNVGALYTVSGELLRGTTRLAVKVRGFIERAEIVGNRGKGRLNENALTIDEAISLASKLSGIVRNATHAGSLAIEMERQLLGTSDEGNNDPQDITLEEAMAELEAVNAEFEAARRAASAPAPVFIDAEAEDGPALALPAPEVIDGTATTTSGEEAGASDAGAPAPGDDDDGAEDSGDDF